MSMIATDPENTGLDGRLRAYSGLTQRELSEESGVTLRMIQLYEQGQNDLSRAQVGVVASLAQVLGCETKALL